VEPDLVGAADPPGEEPDLMTSATPSSSALNRIATAISRLAWILFLVFLPVTSFPYLPPALGGGTLVRPLSIYPLLILLLLSTIPRLLLKPIPKTLLTLLPFVCVAIASSALSLLRDIDPVLGISVPDRILRALLTLAVGGAIYTTVALTPGSRSELRASLRWLYAGFCVALLWGSLQAIYIVNFNGDYFRLLQNAQKYISTRKLFTTRISGLTYEPNWFAEQISMLLVPWLLASVLTRYSLFRWRWKFITVELLLLVWSVIVLAFTFSRAGLASLLVLTVLGVVVFRSHHPTKIVRQAAPLRIWLFRFAEAAVALVVLGSLIYFAGTKNEFFSRIWNYWTVKKEHSLSGYFEYLGFGARFTYGGTAFAVYTNHPSLGVGLGNYAYYFEEHLPDTPLAATPEILRIVTPDVGRDRLITPKNFYYRLLSETGLLGFAAFMAFVLAVLGCALVLWLSPAKEEVYWGTAGLLGIAAFGLGAISFDSFALPNMWVIFGLVTASAWLYFQKTEPQSADSRL
jgi:O-antigen ligase